MSSVQLRRKGPEHGSILLQVQNDGDLYLDSEAINTKSPREGAFCYLDREPYRVRALSKNGVRQGPQYELSVLELEIRRLRADFMWI